MYVLTFSAGPEEYIGMISEIATLADLLGIFEPLLEKPKTSKTKMAFQAKTASSNSKLKNERKRYPQ
jgi:hypothetical protein